MSDRGKMDEKITTSTTVETSTDNILEVRHLNKYFPIAKKYHIVEPCKAIAKRVKRLFSKDRSAEKPPIKFTTTTYLKAVNDVSLDLPRGTTIGIVGESGCGKTTLGRTILRLYDADGGQIVFDGVDITNMKKRQLRKYRTDIQLVFQDPYSSLPPRITVGNIIAEAVKVHNIVPKDQVRDYVRDIMVKCGLQLQYYDRYPHEFSGGQRQRICIARALAVKPKLVICDEPVSALDVSIQAQIINLLKELQNTMGLTYMFISHDLSVVKYITDQILVMYLGNMMEKGETDELFDNPLHPYTKALFSAVPVPDPDVKSARIILQGDIPSPANPPKGCKFHTRCSECMNVCKFVAPTYMEARPNHFVACHLYNKEIMDNLDEYDKQYEIILEEERLAQIEKERKRNFGKKVKKTDNADEQGAAVEEKPDEK